MIQNIYSYSASPYTKRVKKAEAIEYLQQAVTLYPQQGNTTEAQRTAATIQQIQQQR
jgi:hypothetical protein